MLKRNGVEFDVDQPTAAFESCNEVVPFAVEVCGGGPGVMVTQ